VKLDRLVVASKNPDKITEIEQVLRELRLVETIVRDEDWPDVDETGATLEENAVLKASTVARLVGLPALADDTGLEVASLGGGPGVRTARYAGPDATYRDNVERLLSELEGTNDRRARFRTVVALAFPDGRSLVADGTLDGHIVHVPRGRFGFGYDPVFAVGERTLSEIGADEKNAMSHRGRALRALADKVRMT
jgi:XTP/dITP diphosphohydrolase